MMSLSIAKESTYYCNNFSREQLIVLVIWGAVITWVARMSGYLLISKSVMTYEKVLLHWIVEFIKIAQKHRNCEKLSAWRGG